GVRRGACDLCGGGADAGLPAHHAADRRWADLPRLAPAGGLGPVRHRADHPVAPDLLPNAARDPALGRADAVCGTADMEIILQALAQLATPQVVLIMLAAAVYGLTVGAIPGLTATMGVALVIPIAFFLDPVPALAGVMTLSAMAIFAGDLPGALLRIPGTPASAAYVDDSYLMVRRGQGGLALGLCVICSAIGGVVGALVLMGAAPAIARIALQFSSYEKFWLACLGLTAAVAASGGKWY